MSYIDNLIEKAFSDGYEFAYEAMFSKKNKDNKRKHKIHLSELDSHRGLGRSLALGGISGAIGGYQGKKLADELDRDGGYTDKEIIDKAASRGRNVGAAVGAGAGALKAGVLAGGLLLGAHKGTKVINKFAGSEIAKLNKGKAAALATGAMAAGALTHGAFSGLGGYLGAKKNAEERLQKRRNIVNGYYADY